jgi:hypothetical protein
MDAIDIKSSAISQLGGTQFQVMADLSVIYLDGNETEPSDSDITNKIAEIEVQVARKNAYPPIADQLDEIYHNGIDAWKVIIKKVKDDNPKPS